MLIEPRLVRRGTRTRMRNSVLGTDAALAVIVAALCWLIGWEDLLIVWAPAALLAGSVGIWLFYVQHQFENVNWQRRHEWSHADAALRGSSYLKLPKLGQFFTANIGLHHVHHLNTRIPNYNLQRAHDTNAIFAPASRRSRSEMVSRRQPQALGRNAEISSHSHGQGPGGLAAWPVRDQHQPRLLLGQPKRGRSCERDAAVRT